MTSDRPALRPLRDELGTARAHSLTLVSSLTADEVGWRPHAASSAIGWHLGHQAAVGHYLVRNLTAAEPPVSVELDRLFDSATPEPDRGHLPPLDEILDYRSQVEARTDVTLDRIAAGDVGAPFQLAVIAEGLIRALVNHEYQHATWIAEVRARFTDAPVPTPASTRLETIEGYPVLRR